MADTKVRGFSVKRLAKWILFVVIAIAIITNPVQSAVRAQHLIGLLADAGNSVGNFVAGVLP